MGVFAPIQVYMDALQHDERCSGVALGRISVYPVARAAPSTLELIFFTWLLVPLLVAHFLSRAGQYESAHMLSLLVLISGVTTTSGAAAGIGSYAAVWRVLATLEASLLAAGSAVTPTCVFRRVGAPLFQASTACERRHGGTGLGLSIVKGRFTVRLLLDYERARPPEKRVPEVDAAHRLVGSIARPWDETGVRAHSVLTRCQAAPYGELVKQSA